MDIGGDGVDWRHLVKYSIGELYKYYVIYNVVETC
jgi:hypothetical protein